MSARVKKYLPLLQFLADAKPSQRAPILSNASKELILAICEIAMNIVSGRLPITQPQFKKLVKSKTNIKKIASRKTPLYVKKKIISQRGGFLPALIASSVPFLISLFTR